MIHTAMGKLIDPERTKKAKRAREERAERILEAAERAFLRFPYSEITLDTIGQQAGVKQGQATLAFRSREELFMTVLRSRLIEWYDELEARVSAGDEPMTAGAVAELVATSLAERHELTRLLGPLHMVFEVHEDGMQVHQFYRWQHRRLLRIAEAIAGRLPGVDPWDAFDALYRSQLIAAAVHPVSRPVGNLAVDLMAEEHQVFALDLEDEVSRVVSGCLSG
jgi:AcrR family transcriptional regulator